MTSPFRVFLDVWSHPGVCAHGQIKAVGSQNLLWEDTVAYPWNATEAALTGARREALKRGYEIMELP